MDDLALHILDIAENAVAANASLVTIDIVDEDPADRLSLTIRDNGKGMTEEFLRLVMNPFCTTRTTRNVGLGLPLLQQTAQETGGEVTIQSVPGTGTTVTAWFRPRHIDMKPLGNIADTIVSLIASKPDLDLVYCYSKQNRSYRLDTRELRSALENVPLNAADVLDAVRTDITEGMNDILQRTAPLPETGTDCQ